jgi:hypothetical protein
MPYRNNYAKNRQESAYPDLWRGLAYGWSPALYNSGVRLWSPIAACPPVTLVSGVKRQPEAAPVRYSNLFNGTSDAGTTGAALALATTSQLSVCWWMLWDSFADDDDLAWESSANFNSNAGAILCDPNESGGHNWSLAIRNAGATANNFFNFTRPSAAVWHHYVVNIDLAAWVTSGTAAGAITNVWVDGVAQTHDGTTQGSGAGAANFGAYTWYWMSRGAASLFGDGRMGEFLVYRNRLMTINDARAFYRGASPFSAQATFPLRYPDMTAPAAPGGGAVGPLIGGRLVNNSMLVGGRLVA